MLRSSQMSKASYRDLVQPSLLDRLTDERGGRREDGGRTFSLRSLRAVILRDVSWLLNATPLDSSVDLSAYPDVASSVLNYGVRPMAGQGGGTMDRSHFERAIQEALTVFEPRLMRGVRSSCFRPAPATPRWSSSSRLICGRSRCRFA